MNRIINKSWPVALVSGAAGLLSSAAAFAQEAGAQAVETAVIVQTAAAESPIDKADTAWVLVCATLVLFMTIPGIMLFYSGMVRKKNIIATMMQAFGICCVMSILWMIVGYSLAFTEGNAYIGDFSRVFLTGITTDPDNVFLGGTIPESVGMMFQMTFAILTPALIIGAFADRFKFSSLLVFCVLWSLLVYAPIAHWVWAPTGFLANDGVLDFAGGTVVHINAAVAGLIGCILVGKRKGYGTENLAPANLPYALIGGAILWVGWFGFNAGSALTADGRAGMAMAVTQIAAAAAAVAWMSAEWVVRGKPSALGAVSGAVAGLVAITPAAGFVNPTGALIIGLVGGFICCWASLSLKRKLGYDDSLDVWGVHGVGGIVGAILTGVFAVEAIGGTPGLIEGNAGQVLLQLEGVAITIAWCAVVSFVLFKAIDRLMGLRVSLEEEVDGLDISLHGEVIHS